jgi:hypothetical protein
MNPTDPLANLRDIHLPEAISWWPMAPGWWVLLILVSLLTGYLCLKLFNRYKKRHYRRQAIVCLQRLDNLKGQRQLVELFEILKRTAVSAYPDQCPVDLGPTAFIEFLQSTCNEAIFTEMPGDLETLLYGRAKSVPSSEALIQSAMLWVKNHRQDAFNGCLPPC